MKVTVKKTRIDIYYVEVPNDTDVPIRDAENSIRIYAKDPNKIIEYTLYAFERERINYKN